MHCPFGPSEEEDLRWYVEDFARFDPFEASRAEKVKASIPRYVRSLVQSLSISDILVCHAAPLYNTVGTSLKLAKSN